MFLHRGGSKYENTFEWLAHDPVPRAWTHIGLNFRNKQNIEGHFLDKCYKLFASNLAELNGISNSKIYPGLSTPTIIICMNFVKDYALLLPV